MNKVIKFKRLSLDNYMNSYVLKNPVLMYENKSQKLIMMMDKVNNLVIHNIEAKRINLNNLLNNHIIVNPNELYKDKVISLNHIIEKLELVNPLGVLKRGYSLTYKDNKIVNSTKQIKY